MLRELHTFIAVTRYGTFSAAGQRIGLTQSAVSTQIRLLEQHLGMLLFDRSGRAQCQRAAGAAARAGNRDAFRPHAPAGDRQRIPRHDQDRRHFHHPNRVAAAGAAAPVAPSAGSGNPNHSRRLVQSAQSGRGG